MSGQNMYLAMVIAAFGSFAVTLGAVSTWLWISPSKDR
jgi:hypothetical protein